MKHTLAGILNSALLAMLTAGAPRLSAQVSPKQLLPVAVTDSLGRPVTGLDQQSFEVVEKGVGRAIAEFSGADAPMVVVIVSETALPEAAAFTSPDDELFQTRSFADALRQLSASKKPRKFMLTTIAPGTEAIPGDIRFLQTNPANLSRAVSELDDLHSQYLVWVESSTRSVDLEVVLKQPRGLPPLRLRTASKFIGTFTWK